MNDALSFREQFSQASSHMTFMISYSSKQKKPAELEKQALRASGAFVADPAPLQGTCLTGSLSDTVTDPSGSDTGLLSGFHPEQGHNGRSALRPGSFQKP